ncbi:Fc.00g035470.m01.CDS01 [Cosmosporella sp. VM-42]
MVIMDQTQHTQRELPMDLPVINLDLYLNSSRDSDAAQAECRKAADALITYGALVLHDSRVSEDDNTKFLDLLEDYFDQPDELLKKDERPDLSYQIGVTLENTEKPKCAVDEPCLDVIQRLHPSQRPLDIMAHSPDPKCRFFWRMVEPPPYETQFPGLNASNIVPDAPHIKDKWEPTMNQWGTSMRNAVSKLAEMTAVGLGLPAEYFSGAGRYGPHLLAPTASDLKRYGEKDTILAGFHTDLNFLTIHGRSRYPGLNIWARNTGNRIPVKIPAGNYLLVQAGKQIEHITGGLIKAGYHEVVINEKTIETISRRQKDFPHRPLIRISSTMFWHLSSDFDLVPVPKLAEQARKVRADQFNMGRDEGKEAEYPPMKVGHQVQNELKHIALMT